MPGVHLHGYARVCSATTIASAKRVYSDGGRLWAIDGDVNSHGAGGLIAGSRRVFSNGELVVNHTPDLAVGDNAPHIPAVTITNQGYAKVIIGD